MKVVLLLPPSEGKAPGGRGAWTPAGGAFPDLASARAEVAERLANAMVGEAGAAKLLGVKGAALDAAVAANRAVLHGPKVLPAWKRYTGVVWDHFGVATLPPRAHRLALRSVLVPSGLLGVAALDDPVPDYKLKMGASLAGVGVLSTYWRRMATEAIATRCKGAVVIDLLPGEHRRAVDMTALSAKRVIEVDFRTADGRASGHSAKAAKGSLARHLVSSPDPVAALATFSWSNAFGAWSSAGVTTSAAGAIAVIRPHEGD